MPYLHEDGVQYDSIYLTATICEVRGKTHEHKQFLLCGSLWLGEEICD